MVILINYEGFDICVKWQEFEYLLCNDQILFLYWGKIFNGGKINIGVIVNYYQCDCVNLQDDFCWSNVDLSDCVLFDLLWFGYLEFDNISVNLLYGQFDIVDSVFLGNLFCVDGLVDCLGEFEIYLSGDLCCIWELGNGFCVVLDGQGMVCFNMNENWDFILKFDCINVFINVNYMLENGWEVFIELMVYKLNMNLCCYLIVLFFLLCLIVVVDNYYNLFGLCGLFNCFDNELVVVGVFCEGLVLIIDNYCFVEYL